MKLAEVDARPKPRLQAGSVTYPQWRDTVELPGGQVLSGVS
jgi:hypothetical protein